MTTKLPKLGGRFRDLYNDGASYGKIAENLGISVITAMAWRKRLKLPPRRSKLGRGFVSWMDEAKISGKSPREVLRSVSRELGITEKDIEFILTRYDKLKSLGFVQGRNSLSLILASAYLYLRWEGSGRQPISAMSFVKVCRAKRYKIDRPRLLMNSRLFKEARLFPASHLRPQELLERKWMLLKREYNLPEEVKDAAICMMSVPTLIQGKIPEAVAAGTLYVAAFRNGILLGQADLSQEFGITPVSLRSMKSRIELLSSHSPPALSSQRLEPESTQQAPTSDHIERLRPRFVEFLGKGMSYEEIAAQLATKPMIARFWAQKLGLDGQYGGVSPQSDAPRLRAKSPVTEAGDHVKDVEEEASIPGDPHQSQTTLAVEEAPKPRREQSPENRDGQ